MVDFYRGLVSLGKALQSPFLLLVRLFWGWSFFSTGLAKLMHMDEVISYFILLGIPVPAFSAYLVAIVELVGGSFLFVGLASRLVCLPLICNMVVAYATAEVMSLMTIFENPQNFITRTPFTFLFASLLILIFGPGRFSLDRLLEKYVFKKS